MNVAGKKIDTTYLSCENAEHRGFIHRDYIAHCLRWSHVVKQLTKGKLYERATIVDVGCGREVPLAKTLYSSRLIVSRYCAIDYGPIPEDSRAIFGTGKFPIEFYEKTDFVKWADNEEPSHFADVVTCFEVLEHVEPKHMLEMLQGIKLVMKPNATAYISTPCWDVVSCAANHVNEMRYEALGAVLEAAGFVIKNVYGTFASIKDYEPYMDAGHREAFNDLRDYYDVNFLACVFAPFYPQYSRNCLWELGLQSESEVKLHANRKFQPLTSVPEPWGSSSLWREMSSSSPL